MVAYKIMTFESVRDTLKAEKAVRETGLSADAISVPRHLSDDCGIALKFGAAIEDEIVALLNNKAIPFKGVYDDADR